MSEPTAAEVQLPVLYPIEERSSYNPAKKVYLNTEAGKLWL